MLNKIRALLVRWGYRFLSARAWRHWHSDLPYSLLQIPTDEGSLPLRMYVGQDGGNKPLIVYFHGGGWVIGDLRTHHPICQALCTHSGCTIVSVEYRLAPEHTYPAAHDDCLAATRWVSHHLEELGPSNGQIILAGDSAGANLATSTCLTLGESERSAVVGEIVIYPVTDYYTCRYPSHREKAKGYALSTAMLRWFWDTYLAEKEAVKAPLRTTPLRAPNLALLPATLLVTAEHDPLRDEGIAYRDKLQSEGVSVQYRHFDHAEHGFACSFGVTPDFELLMSDISQWLHTLPPAGLSHRIDT